MKRIALIKELIQSIEDKHASSLSDEITAIIGEESLNIIVDALRSYEQKLESEHSPEQES